MSKNHNTNRKFSDKIRNVPAFVRAYFKGEHGKRQLSRSVPYKEVTQIDSKGKPITHRENIGYNTFAYAMHEAFC